MRLKPSLLLLAPFTALLPGLLAWVAGPFFAGLSALLVCAGLLWWQQHMLRTQAQQTEALAELADQQVAVRTQFTTYLQGITRGEAPDAPELPANWAEVSRLLRGINLYLTISRRSLEDRQQLYDEMEDKLEENAQKLDEHASRLRQNERQLQRSEVKVLAYTLALQQIHQIQRQIQGHLHMDALVADATALLATHLHVREAVFLRFKGERADVIAAVHSAYSIGHQMPAGPLRLLASSGEQPQEAVTILTYEHLELLPQLWAEQALVIPLRIDQEIWGVLLMLDRQERLEDDAEPPQRIPFQESDFLILRNVIAFVQKDLRSARLFEMATVDSLSQLYMRRYFESRLNDEVRRALRHPSAFSVLMIDIDYFKKVNDTYGHLVGDEVIQLVATVLKKQLRQGLDLPARYGGEEMVVLLPETAAQDALVVAERVRRAIASLEIEPLAATRSMPHITVSIGVASYPDHGHDTRSLLEAADQSLYQAKTHGRNRVCLSEKNHETHTALT